MAAGGTAGCVRNRVCEGELNGCCRQVIRALPRETWDQLRVLGVQGSYLRPDGKPVGRNTVQRLLGFWFIWTMTGGTLKDAVESGFSPSRCASASGQQEFIEVFGCEPGQFVLEPLQKALPGVEHVFDDLDTSKLA